MAGATIIDADPSTGDSVTRAALRAAALAKLAGLDPWPEYPPNAPSANNVTLGAGLVTGVMPPTDYVVTGGAGLVLFTRAGTTRTIGLHGTARVSDLTAELNTWEACGRPRRLRAVTSSSVPPLKLEGIPRAQVRAATSDAYSGIIEGAEPVTLAAAVATLDGMTPYLWAVEDDRKASRVSPGIFAHPFTVLVVV